VAQFGISREITDEHDFVKIGHNEKFAGGGRRLGERNLCDPLEVLKVNVIVQAQAALDLGDHFWCALEVVVHVMAGREVAGIVGEFAATELIDLFDGGAFGGEVFGDSGDEIVNAAFEGFGIKDDQALVFATHR
jgi:hypothetical protein